MIREWFKRTFLKDDPINEEREKLKSKKDEATERGEPWVGILSLDVNPEHISEGAFELDWNDFFIAKLVRAGYQGKTDADLVDQWFTTVCRNVVLETYEQDAADRHPVKSRKLDDGRREYN